MIAVECLDIISTLLQNRASFMSIFRGCILFDRQNHSGQAISICLCSSTRIVNGTEPISQLFVACRFFT